MFYVSATDKFCSGWGMARNKVSKMVYLCETEDEALLVYNNCRRRTDLKRISISKTEPRFNNAHVSYFTKKDASIMYTNYKN